MDGNILDAYFATESPAHESVASRRPRSPRGGAQRCRCRTWNLFNGWSSDFLSRSVHSRTLRSFALCIKSGPSFSLADWTPSIWQPLSHPRSGASAQLASYDERTVVPHASLELPSGTEMNNCTRDFRLCNKFPPMKTLTVRLPEDLIAQIEAESRRRRLSKSDVLRERLTGTKSSLARCCCRGRRLD